MKKCALLLIYIVIIVSSAVAVFASSHANAPILPYQIAQDNGIIIHVTPRDASEDGVTSTIRLDEEGNNILRRRGSYFAVSVDGTMVATLENTVSLPRFFEGRWDFRFYYMGELTESYRVRDTTFFDGAETFQIATAGLFFSRHITLDSYSLEILTNEVLTINHGLWVATVVVLFGILILIKFYRRRFADEANNSSNLRL